MPGTPVQDMRIPISGNGQLIRGEILMREWEEFERASGCAGVRVQEEEEEEEGGREGGRWKAIVSCQRGRVRMRYCYPPRIEQSCLEQSCGEQYKQDV